MNNQFNAFPNKQQQFQPQNIPQFQQPFLNGQQIPNPIPNVQQNIPFQKTFTNQGNFNKATVPPNQQQPFPNNNIQQQPFPNTQQQPFPNTQQYPFPNNNTQQQPFLNNNNQQQPFPNNNIPQKQFPNNNNPQQPFNNNNPQNKQTNPIPQFFNQNFTQNPKQASNNNETPPRKTNEDQELIERLKKVKEEAKKREKMRIEQYEKAEQLINTIIQIN